MDDIIETLIKERQSSIRKTRTIQNAWDIEVEKSNCMAPEARNLQVKALEQDAKTGALESAIKALSSVFCPNKTIGF